MNVFRRSMVAGVLACVLMICLFRPTAASGIDVPYYGQGRGESGGSTYWCWAASGSMMFKYYLLDTEGIMGANMSKPWWWADFYNKQPYEYANLLEVEGMMVFGNVFASWTTQPLTWDWIDQATIVSQLSLGRPIMGLFMDIGGNAGHVVVLTGYDGTSVYVNDPQSDSGLFYPAYGSRIGRGVSWADFFDAIDQTDWSSDGYFIYNSALIQPSAGVKATIDLGPDDPSWGRSGWGIRAETDSSNYINLEWNGEGHPGYYFAKGGADTIHPNSPGGTDYGACVVPSDTVKFTPVISCCSPGTVYAEVELSIKKGSTEVASASAYRTLSGRSHLLNDTLFSVPVSNFSQVDEGVHSASVVLKVWNGSSYVEHDRVSMNFYLDLDNPAPPMIDTVSCPSPGHLAFSWTAPETGDEPDYYVACIYKAGEGFVTYNGQNLFIVGTPGDSQITYNMNIFDNGGPGNYAVAMLGWYQSGPNEGIYVADSPWSDWCYVSAAGGNLGFEYGDLTGWYDDGDCRVVTSQGNATPREGSYMGIITSGSGAVDNKYSHIYVPLQIPYANAYVSFRWNFLSNEYPQYVGTEYNDIFTVYVSNQQGQWDLVVVSSDVNSADWSSSSSGYNGETGWRYNSFNASNYGSPGQYVWVLFRVMDVGDTVVDSASLIDSLQIQ